MLAERGHGIQARLESGEVDRRLQHVELSRRRTDLRPAPARLELRVAPEVLHVVEARVGDIGRLEALDDLVGRKPREHLVHFIVKFVPVLEARRTAREARIGLQQRGLAQYAVAEGGELALVLHAQEHRLPIGGLERPVRHDGRVIRPGARRRRAAVGGEERRKAHPFAQRFEHGDVDRRAFAGALAAHERRQDRS